MDPLKAISWRGKRVKQLENWTLSICYQETLEAFTDVVFGVRYFFPDPSEALHRLLRLGIVQYRRFYSENSKKTGLGVFVSPNLGHRAIYFLYKKQHEELVAPEKPLSHFKAITRAEEGLDLYDSELQVRVEYEEVEKGKKQRKTAIWDFYNKEKAFAVEVETGKNNAAQVAQHVRAALHTRTNLTIVFPECETLHLLNYYTQCVFRGLSRSRRLPPIRIELREVSDPETPLRSIQVSNRPRVKSSIPGRFFTEKEYHEEYWDPDWEIERWRKYTKRITKEITVPFPEEVRVKDTYNTSKEQKETKLREEFKNKKTPQK